MNIPDQDSLLVSQAQKGRIEALQALYEKYFAAIYRFCYWQTGQIADAQDLTQEVFLVVVKSVPKFRQEASFKNWLYAIAKNIVARWISHPAHRFSRPLLETMADSPQWVDQDNLRFKQKLVKKLLNHLSPDEKKVVPYRYLRQLSVGETAQKLHLSQSNVKVINHRALQKLKKLASQALEL